MTARLNQALSTDATNLLAALRAAQQRAKAEDRPVAHITDSCLANYCSITRRGLFDAVRELLNANYLLLADGRGRWLGSLAEAIAYRDSRRRRIASEAGGIAALNRAIRAHQGQLELPLHAGGQP